MVRLLCMQRTPGVCRAEAQGENAGAPQQSLTAPNAATHESRHDSTLDCRLHVISTLSRGVDALTASRLATRLTLSLHARQVQLDLGGEVEHESLASLAQILKLVSSVRGQLSQRSSMHESQTEHAGLGGDNAAGAPPV